MTGTGSAKRTGLRPKNLCGIPWRVALSLQSAGWYLRADVIWHKPNCMPSSVTDRPTLAHEYIFLLTKSEHYFYNAEAIKETGVYPAGVEATGSLARFGRDEKFVSGNAHRGSKIPITTGYRNARSVWSIVTEPTSEGHFATFPTELVKRCILAGCPAGGTVLDPFAGTATTGRVAMDNGNEFIGIELNPKYAAMAERKLAQSSLLAGA